MLTSPRIPSMMIRIFSSEEYVFRVFLFKSLINELALCFFAIINNLMILICLNCLSYFLGCSVSLSADVKQEQKRKLQKMVFPEGIEYDHENDVYRTFRVNVIFELIRSLSTENKDKKRGFSQFEPKKSHLVAGTRLELATFGL